jgi:hypothetical protein
MGVGRGERLGLGRGSSQSRVPIWQMIAARTPNTPHSTATAHQASHSLLTCLTMAHRLLWLSFLFFFFHLASSHLIEVPASKKECFFEDLHVNDQVQRHRPRQSDLPSPFVPDDRYVPGWRWWPFRHRLLGKSVSPLTLWTSPNQVVDPQPRRKCDKKDHTVLNWDRVHHCRARWPVRVLLFQSNEFNCG